MEEDLSTLSADDLITRVGIAEASRLKKVAGLLLTYRCSIACPHCLFSCTPRLPDRHASVEDGIAFAQQLHATGRVVHVAGGEAMLYYETMLAICRGAAQVGAAPHFFETNSSWCREDGEVRRRYQALRDAGMRAVYLSADPYHQRFVPPERRYRGFRIAVEVFGRANVYAAELDLPALETYRAVGRDAQRTAEHARAYPPQMVGRAADDLAQHFAPRPLAEILRDGPHAQPGGRGDCRGILDPGTSWEVHVDLDGRILVNCGFILGSARRTPLPEVLARGLAACGDMVAQVHEHGPGALLEMAVARGYQPRPQGYADKCHLCWETRRFLRAFLGEVLGPAEIFGTAGAADGAPAGDRLAESQERGQ